MRVANIEELENDNIFKETEILFGYKNFEDLQEDRDDLIFYADGTKESVIEAMKEEFHAKPFHCVAFDGWYVSLLSK